jgi:hypothetical protein
MRTAVIIAATALLAAGCGSSKVAPVEGRVTLDGKPLPNASVAFQPVGDGKNAYPGHGSMGKTDADGKYRLQLVGEDGTGAVIGKHRVEISAASRQVNPENDKERAPPNLVPAKYNRDSELTFEVTSAGTKEANFDLKSR